MIEGFISLNGNVVSNTLYLTSTDTVQQALAFYAAAFADVPSSTGDFSVGSFDVKNIELTLPGGQREYSAPLAQIGVAAAARRVSIAVRISATWNPRRPVDTYIGPSPGTVDVHQGPAYGTPTFTATVTGTAATRLAATVDDLGIRANETYSCPTGAQLVTTLIFHPPAHVITVTLLDGCPPGPFLDVGGASYTLTSDGIMWTTLQSVLPSLPTR